MKKLIPLLIVGPLIALTTACTPKQIQDWVAWHDQDPAAAEEFAALPEIQAALQDTGSDGPQFAQYLETGGWTTGDCSSFAEEAAAAGLPWGIFGPIARRESGCNPYSWVVDSDDTGGGLFGQNFKGSTLVNHWRNLCGATTGNIRGNVALQMECAAAQYHQYGMGAWR
jgi:hypothetical protein